jgi:hypothetical protein
MAFRQQRGESNAALLVGLLLFVGLAGWQIYLGSTVQKIGIPGVLEIDLGRKPPVFCMAEDSGYDRYGSDYNGGPQMKDLHQCEASCVLDDQCQALSFHKTSNQCWLKKGPGLRQPNAQYIAAVKVRC